MQPNSQTVIPALTPETVTSQLMEMVHRISSLPLTAADCNANLFHLGMDSFMLARLRQIMHQDFGVDIELSRFYAEADTLSKIAAVLVRESDRRCPPPIPTPAPEPVSAPSLPASPPVRIVRDAQPGTGGTPWLQDIFHRQLEAMSNLMTHQLAILNEWETDSPSESVREIIGSTAAKPDIVEKPGGSNRPEKSFAITPVASSISTLTSAQKEFIRDFTNRWNHRTPGSKQLTQSHRAQLCDWLQALGFRPELKECIYPLTCSRSDGAYFWDIDGNAYIDLAMGYGVSFLGHRPPYVVEAVTRQLDLGFHLGPQFDLTGTVARLICEMTGVERVAFTNTGTEAVMAAVRTARAVTCRPQVALFAGSYHGTFDGILADTDGKRPNAIPRSAGTPLGMVADVLVLNYGDQQALEIIRQNGSNLAAVLVEPVQSRRPGFHPTAFLQELRHITAEQGTALIFDEVITGFRIHPGGAQHYFNVKADLVTYGKVLGGGMPIGVVAGKAAFLDAVDGGFWSFGDDTAPMQPKLLFAGTFCKHPLAMVAAKAVLEHLKTEGPALQENLNQRVAAFAAELNNWFEKERVPMQLRHFGSLFRFESFGQYDLALAPIEMDLFFLLLLYRGIYTWERRICFFSTVHSDADMAQVITAVRECIQELRSGGFSFESSPPVTSDALQSDSLLPASSAQKRLFVLSQMESGEVPYHLTGSILMDGQLDKDRLTAAFRTLFHRHESLRTAFEIQQDQICQRVFDTVEVSIEFARIEADAAEDFARGMIRPFDLHSPPLARIGLAEIAPNRHLMIFDMYHMIGDGISGILLVQELIRLYMGENLPPVSGQYRDYVQWEQSYLNSKTCTTDKTYWQRRLDRTVPLNLPLDFPRPDKQQFHGRVLRHRWTEQDTRQFKALAARLSTTPYMLMLSVYTVLLHRLSGQTDILVGTTTSGRLTPSFESIVGMFANTLVMRLFPECDLAFDRFVLNVTQHCLQDFSHQGMPFEVLVESVQIPRDIRRNMLFDTLYVYENAQQRSLQLPSMTITPFLFDRRCAMFDLTLEIIEKETISVNLEYNTGLFREATASAILKSVHDIFVQVADRPQIRCQEIVLDSFGSFRAPTALTDHQSRLWFVDRFESGVLYPHSPVYYNMPLILRWNGPLNQKILSESLQAIVNRHHALHIQIVGNGDAPGQIVMDRVDMVLRMLDAATETPPVESEKRLPENWMDTSMALAMEKVLIDSAQPFELDHPPLFRAAILSVDAENHILALTAHHIICDPWSLEQVAVECLNDYRSRLSGQIPECGVPDMQFPEAMKEDPAKLAIQEKFWTACLGKDCKPLNLPMDHPRPAIQTYRSGFEMFSVPEDVVSALRTLAGKLNVSLTTVLMAAFDILLFRYSRQSIVITGTPCRSGDRPASAVGHYANLLVMKADFQNDPTVADLISQVDRYRNQAMENLLFPFDRLVQAMNPEKDMSRTALFDILFVCREDIPDLPTGTDFSARMIQTHHGWGKYDLTLGLQIQDPNICGSFVYNRDMFESDTISRMLGHFQTILSEMSDRPDAPVSRLKMLNQAEYNHLEASLNATPVSYPENKSLHELFADQARRYPDNPAVIGENDRLTYRQLDSRADALARLLVERGVGPDRMVGICMEKSTDVVVAVFSILKAGGAYLPLDPDLPQERLGFMLADADVRVVLTRKSLHHLFEGFKDAGVSDTNPDIHILCSQTLAAELPGTTGDPLHLACSPDHLAYMIYTSGSTGTPKGVLITHRNVVRLIVNDRFDFDFSDQDVWTLFHAFSFDFSVWEMFGPLLYGGCLALVPRLTAQEPRQFLEFLKTHRVTVLNQTPTAFYALIPHIVADVAEGTDPLALRYVIFGGDALTPALLKPFRDIYPRVNLVNMYGITETTVHVTYKALTDADIRTDSHTIGRPLPDLRVHILDRHLQPVPPGVWGEICVAGNGLARGYLNRPELTAEKFTTLPWQPQERIYRSGDLGRWRSDSELEYLGRADDQVKIRGYRIETREVVHHLLAHPNIRQAVVLAHTDHDGSQSLRAYLVADHPLKAADIRRHLQARLPEYMLPMLFQVPQIPMTINGKVDAPALPAMTLTEIEPEDPFQPPRNDMEARMAAVWQAVLGRERVGIHDNFFELGGHSLKAAQVVFRLQQVLEKEIRLRDFFSAPTISALAAVLQERGVSRLPDIIPAPDAPDYDLSYAQRRLWVVDQVYGDSPAYHMSGAFLLTGRLDKAALQGVFQTLTDRHESLRTVFVTVGSEPRQRILKALNITLEEMDLTGSTDPEKDAHAGYLAETARPFDLKNGPLLRVQLFRLPDIDTLPRHVLVINLHHIITDGWSVQVMIQEMSAVYPALCRGEQPALVPLTLQYKDYAFWQHQQIQSPALSAQRDYWMNQLAPPLPDLSLPLDFSRPRVQSQNGRRLRFMLPPELVHELDRLEQSGRVTRFMIFAAGITTLLHCLSRRNEVCVGTPVAGRIHPDLETQIGFYLNILVLRTRLNPDQRLSDVLQDMGKTVTDALDHQAYPFDLLVEDLKLKRDPARHPLFDVLIIVQNNAPAQLNWEGVQVDTFADEAIASSFDLKFTVEPGAGWRIAVEYNTDLFREVTIQGLAQDLQRILELLTRSPQMTVNGVMRELRPEAFAEESEFLKSALATDEAF